MTNEFGRHDSTPDYFRRWLSLFLTGGLLLTSFATHRFLFGSLGEVPPPSPRPARYLLDSSAVVTDSDEIRVTAVIWGRHGQLGGVATLTAPRGLPLEAPASLDGEPFTISVSWIGEKELEVELSSVREGIRVREHRQRLHLGRRIATLPDLRLTFDGSETDAQSFFRTLATLSGLEMIIDPAVSGRVVMPDTPLTLEQALHDAAVRSSASVQVQGNVVFVSPQLPERSFDQSVSAPRPIIRLYPQPTDAARNSHALEMVLVQFWVNENGRVDDVALIRGGAFGNAEKALEAALHWTFVPALQNGRPVASTASAPVRFHFPEALAARQKGS
jgi:TonB family protein